MPPTRPNAAGLFRRGSVYEKMTIAPENRPAVPTPARARPMMKAVELGARAETRLPSSKMATAERNDSLMSKILYILPYVGCRAVVVRRYPAPYQPMSLTLWNSDVIAPSAGAMMVWSSATFQTSVSRTVGGIKPGFCSIYQEDGKA